MNLELVASKITPDLIIDCGAHCGFFVGDARAYWPNAEYFCIEANPECEQALEALDVKHRIAVLSDTEREVDFYTLKDCPCATGASYYRELTPIFSNGEVKVEKVRTQTLDNILQDFPIQDRTILAKLDTQGSEVDILHGAQKTLKHIQAVILEVAFTNYNLNAPLANDVIKFMEESGFKSEEVIGNHIHPLEGHFIQSDILFLRKQ